MDRYERYAKKCRLFKIRFRKGKDDKYINFLEQCPNKTDFMRQAIEQALK